MSIVQRIEPLFDRWGRRPAAAPHGRQSLLDHALRCADLAQSSPADAATIPDGGPAPAPMIPS